MHHSWLSTRTLWMVSHERCGWSSHREPSCGVHWGDVNTIKGFKVAGESTSKSCPHCLGKCCWSNSLMNRQWSHQFSPQSWKCWPQTGSADQIKSSLMKFQSTVKASLPEVWTPWRVTVLCRGLQNWPSAPKSHCCLSYGWHSVYSAGWWSPVSQISLPSSKVWNRFQIRQLFNPHHWP